MTHCRKNFSAVVVFWVAGAILLGGALAERTALAQAKGKAETLTGVVSDSVCGAMHPESDAKKCIATCIKGEGAEYVLVVGEKVYTLKGKTAGVEKLAGAKAKVTGTVDGTTIQVASISSAG